MRSVPDLPGPVDQEIRQRIRRAIQRLIDEHDAPPSYVEVEIAVAKALVPAARNVGVRVVDPTQIHGRDHFEVQVSGEWVRAEGAGLPFQLTARVPFR